MDYIITLGLCFISIISYAQYMVLLKPLKKRLIVFFWANVFAYLGYLSLYFVRKTILHHDTHAVEELLYEFTLTNVPLYILMALCWVGSLIILDLLMEKYDVSLVVPVTEIGILFTTIGYLLLGSQFSWIVIGSVSTVFIGALLSGMDKISWPNPFEDLKKIPKPLLAGGIIQSLLESSAMLVTFLCTNNTNITKNILSWLYDTFHHIYNVPFSFYHPFYYNVGVRFFISFIFILYLLIFRKHRWDIVTELTENTRTVLSISFLFFVGIMSYHMAYHNMPDKNVLSALRKLTIPTILFISYFQLEEKITQPKVIGCTIIVIGGMMSLLV